MQNLLMLFTKNPIKGHVKTRLAKSIGDSAAYEIYLTLLHYTSKVAKEVNVQRRVFYDQFIPERDSIFSELFFEKSLQAKGDLGEKMADAFQKSFQQGFQAVVIIGSDCPELTPHIIERAFEQLQKYDAVLGPASDGGYYLLGLKQYNASLFFNKVWSHSSVLQDAIHELEASQKTYYLLPQLSDIDEEKDLHLLQQLSR